MRARLAFAVAALFLGSCTENTVRELLAGVPLMAVLAPRGGEADAVGSLVDGRIETQGWYCSSRPTPQRYEVMAADLQPRSVRAVGFVPGNLGPDGVGAVEVRVQAGHGVSAQGETFRARVRGQNEQVQLIELPHPVRGDHVVLTFLRGSPYRTATCVGELLVYDAEHPEPAEGVNRVRAEPPPEPGSPAAPGVEAAHEADAGVATDAGIATDAGAPATPAAIGADATAGPAVAADAGAGGAP